MVKISDSLTSVFDGWDGHNRSIVNAITPLTKDQLIWRPSEKHRSTGELVRHISLGRIIWFSRMDAPKSKEIAAQISDWETDSDGNRHIIEDALSITEDAAELSHWLELSWEMIEETLASWKISDLGVSYNYVWNGKTYANSRQWTIYRILTHDVHHGGELSLMLGMQGIEAFELSGLFGHITLPPLASE